MLRRSILSGAAPTLLRVVVLEEPGVLSRQQPPRTRPSLGVHEVRADEHTVGQLRLELRLVRSRCAATLSFSSASDGGSYLDSSNVPRLVALQQLLMSTHRVEELGEGDDRVPSLRDEPVMEVAHLVLSVTERVVRERH
jgi:hypothetical protein